MTPTPCPRCGRLMIELESADGPLHCHDCPDPLAPGEHYGLSGGGWPPATVERAADGRYYLSRLTSDLKDTSREEITAADAAGWIAAESD